MRYEEITLVLPDPLLHAAQGLARRRDVSLGQVLRDALTDAVDRDARPAKTPNRADERLVGPLRSLLAVDFGQARSWPDLQSRLTAKGVSLREAGGGLALHSHPGGRRLCKASELGHAYRSLMVRFGAPFPGHSHTNLADRWLARAAGEDFDVIEPF